MERGDWMELLPVKITPDPGEESGAGFLRRCGDGVGVGRILRRVIIAIPRERGQTMNLCRRRRVLHTY